MQHVQMQQVNKDIKVHKDLQDMPKNLQDKNRLQWMEMRSIKELSMMEWVNSLFQLQWTWTTTNNGRTDTTETRIILKSMEKSRNHH